MHKFRFPIVLALITNAALAIGQTLPRALPDLNLRTSGTVGHLATQADGKLIVAGTYSEVGDVPASTLCRFNVDGSLDSTWVPSIANTISALAVSDDGNLYVASAAGGVAKIPLAGSGANDPTFEFPDGRDVAQALVVEGGYLYTAAEGELRRYAVADGSRDTAWIGTEYGDTLVSDHAGHFYSGVTRVNVADGSVDAGWTAPTISGAIRATALSTDGYLYVAADGRIGGLVDGLARLPLGANGTPDATWRPVADGAAHTGNVKAILPLEDGSAVVSGAFQQMGGLERANLARIVGAAGSADANWNADADGNVSSLVKGTAGTVIAGGAFTVAGGNLHASLVRLGSGGTADAAYTPALYAPATVQTIVPDPVHGRVYVGGVFDWVGTERHRNVLRLDASGHLDSSWAPATDAPYPQAGGTRGVQAIVIASPYVYVGGLFSTVSGVARRALVRIDEAAPGGVDPDWAPDLQGSYFDSSGDSSVDGMLIDRQNRLVVGGDFRHIDGVGQPMLARFAANGSLDTTWQPAPYYPVTRIAYDGGDTIYAITNNVMNGESTPHKISSSSGEFDAAWDEGASLEAAFDIVVAGSGKLLVAGGSTLVDAHVLRLDQQTGAVDEDWSPITSCFPRRLSVDGTTVYAAGSDFSGSTSRACVQRFDADGAVDASFAAAWADNSDTRSLAIGGGAAYVGGIFDSTGGVERRALAAFDGADELFSSGFD